MQYAPTGHQYNVFVLSFQNRIGVNAGNALLAYARKDLLSLNIRYLIIYPTMLSAMFGHKDY